MPKKNQSLINIDPGKVPEKLYDDIFSNPGKKIGEALGTIINVGNTLLWPIKWANERTRIYFENNIKGYENKLKNVDEDKIIEVPTEISMPILERFTYVSNEEISTAFINLLTSASSVETIQYAHPSFIQIIDRLSPDEAKILKYISDNDPIPYISLSKYSYKKSSTEDLTKIEHEDQIDTSKYTNIINRRNEIANHVSLNFPNNLNLYMDNIVSLGLIRDTTEFTYVKLEEKYENIKKNILEEFKINFEDLPENIRSKSQYIKKGMFELTDFGKLFIKASLKV